MGSLLINSDFAKIVTMNEIGLPGTMEESLQEKLHSLVNSLQLSLPFRSLNQTADKILPELFELRIDLLSWLAQSESNMEDYLAKLDDILHQNQAEPTTRKLGKTINLVLSYYSIIIEPLIKQLSTDDFGRAIRDIDKDRPTYATFQSLSTLGTMGKILKYWIDSSLMLDFGLVVADLSLAGQVDLRESRIKKDLIPFLYDKIEMFGAYSILIEGWMPDDDQRIRDSRINKMVILSSTIALENKMGKELSTAELKALFA